MHILAQFLLGLWLATVGVTEGKEAADRGDGAAGADHGWGELTGYDWDS